MEKIKSLEFEFNLKTRTKFGLNQALDLGKYLKELSFKRIGIIVDSGVYNYEYIKEVLKNVEKENFDAIKIWEYNLTAEPDYESLDRIKLEFLDADLKNTVGCFVGIGGGSVIDFTKGLAILVVNPGKAINYRGFPTNINPPLPVVALPTTAGTASEVTYNAVFVDLTGKKKLGINTMHNFPILAILDPKLVATCPKIIFVSSGMDALTHVLESYVATKSNVLTKILSKEAFPLIFNNLPKVLSAPENMENLGNLQIGSYLAGISLMNSGSGPAGALSYILGVNFKVPHGMAGAVFLPHIVEHNIMQGYDYSELYDLVEGVDKSKPKEEKNKEFSKMVFNLCDKMGVPQDLKTFGVNQENINVLLNEAENLEKAFAQNSVPFSVEDGKKLLIKLIK